MNITKLERDWAEDPQLKFYASDTVEELAAHLRKVHTDMMNGEHGWLGACTASRHSGSGN